MRFRDEATLNRARTIISEANADLNFAEDTGEGSERRLRISLKAAAERTLLENSVKQNITTLNNRINELGVAEPVIAQQGPDRIVVQLPGVQDTARAKDILGRTATLEARLVNTGAEAQTAVADQGPVPFGSELFRQGRGAPVVLFRDAIFTGGPPTSACLLFPSPGPRNRT